MCCKGFWRKIITFSLALTVGLVAAEIVQTNYLQTNKQEVKTPCRSNSVGEGSGIGSGNGFGGFEDQSEKLNAPDLKIKPLQILSKPRANYTDTARKNEVQGTVRLRVVFLASREIGSIYPIGCLPDGLTEQAVMAASQIKFQPQTQNGKPVNVTKVIEYSFAIY